MGGGCYGTFYARQLLRARAAGALVVDAITLIDSAVNPRAVAELADPILHHRRQDWDDFLDEQLAGADPPPDDVMVTPPFTPHLAVRWLLRALPRHLPGSRWSVEPFAAQPEIPFHRQSPGGPLLLSHADWVCPVNCIEPERCPKTRGPRDWDMDATARELARTLGARGQDVGVVALFHCHHIAYGVGGFPLVKLPEAARAIGSAASGAREGELRALVGTISHCHGALHLLSGAVTGTETEAPSAAAAPTSRAPTPDDRDR